jgi:hypothetical protein
MVTRSRAEGAESAVLAVPHLALVMDAERLRLRAVREDVPQFWKLHVAVLLDQAGDVIAADAAAWLALDRQGRGAKVQEGVRVVSHMPE